MQHYRKQIRSQWVSKFKGSASIPWSEKSSRFTTRFETYAIDVLQATDVTKASKILRITRDEAWHIMDKAVNRGLARK